MKTNSALTAEAWKALPEERRVEGRIVEKFLLFARELGVELFRGARFSPLADPEIERLVVEFCRRRA